MAKNITYYNLTGGLNSLQGLGTINQSPNRTESPDMLNVEYYKLGGLKTMDGNTQMGSTLPSKITLGYEYIYGNNTYLIVTTADGRVYIYDRVIQDFSQIYEFPNPTDRHSIISFNNGIIISNGIDDLVYYIYGRNDLLTGTITGVAQSYTVTGTGTQFETQLSRGDRIRIGELTYQVSKINSNTELTLTTTIAINFTDSDYYLTEISECNAVLTNEDDSNINQPIRGLAIASYKGRIWVGADDGTLYYSELGLIHGWDVKYDAGAIPQFYDDNSKFSALGTWSEYLTIHKKEQTYLLDATSEDSGSWAIKPYSDYTCDSQQSFVVANNGYYVFSRAAGGIYPMLSRSIYNTLYQAKETSLKIRDNFEYLNTAMYDRIFPVYYPSKKYIMFYLPMLFGVGSNDCYIFDLQTGSWLHRQVPQDVSIAFQYDDKVYIGTTDGKILEEFSGKTFDGEPINFYWKSPFFTWGGGTNWTTTKEFRVKLSEEESTNCLVRTYRDGGSTPTSRRINNQQTNLQSLVWDVGYQSSDFYYTGENQLPEEIPVYKLTGSNGEVYYTDNLPGDDNPIKLYSDPECTVFVNYSNLITEIVDGTEDDYNILEYQEVNSYGYARVTETTKPNYYGYRSTSDNRVLAWIDPDNTNTAYVTLHKVSQRVRSFYGYKFRCTGGVGGVTASYGIGLKNPSYWTDGVTRQYPDVGIFPLDVNGNGTFPGTYYSGLQYGNKQSTVKTNGNSQVNWQLTSAAGTGEQWLSPNVEFTRRSDWDTYTTQTVWEYNGSDSINNTTEFTTSNFSTNSVTINGVVYNRDTSQDILETGENIEFVKWSPNSSLEVGDYLYNNIRCTEPYVQIEAVSDNVYYINQDEDIYVIRYPSSDRVYSVPIYKKKVSITYTIDEEYNETIPNPLYYKYPTENLNDNLTDTVWNNYSWYKTTHITKRFPLAKQYFQSLQIEFYGTAEDENLCIYGFEVDGIELTEVPW